MDIVIEFSSKIVIGVIAPCGSIINLYVNTVNYFSWITRDSTFTEKSTAAFIFVIPFKSIIRQCMFLTCNYVGLSRVEFYEKLPTIHIHINSSFVYMNKFKISKCELDQGILIQSSIFNAAEDIEEFNKKRKRNYNYEVICPKIIYKNKYYLNASSGLITLKTS